MDLLVYKFLIIILLLIVVNCTTPMEPDVKFTTITGILGELQLTNLLIAEQFFSGWFIETEIDLQYTTFTLYIEKEDGRIFEPKMEVFATKIFIYRYSIMTDNTRYILNIVQKI